MHELITHNHAHARGISAHIIHPVLTHHGPTQPRRQTAPRQRASTGADCAAALLSCLGNRAQWALTMNLSFQFTLSSPLPHPPALLPPEQKSAREAGRWFPEVLPRCSRSAPEAFHLRRGVSEVLSSCSRGAPEVLPRCFRGAHEVPRRYERGRGGVPHLRGRLLRDGRSQTVCKKLNTLPSSRFSKTRT